MSERIVGWYVENEDFNELVGLIYSTYGIYLQKNPDLQSEKANRSVAIGELVEQLSDHIKKELCDKVDRSVAQFRKVMKVSPVRALSFHDLEEKV